MVRHALKTFPLFLVMVLIVTGCATTKARKPDPADSQAQIESLRQEVQAKDQQIQDLQYQLDSYQQSIQTTVNVEPVSRSSSSAIRVAGVSVKSVQRALKSAGFDPGPIDGRLGSKTKTAIKSFQKRNGLKADGIVGEKTWSLLNA